jgi:membrane protease YdiL (CAAX protease family)
VGRSAWRWIAAVEVAVVVAVVALDLVIPTLVVLVLLAVSLLARREGLGSIGLRRVTGPGRLAIQVVGWTVAWTAVQFGLVMPVLNRVTGQTQDVSAFEDLRGDLPSLLILLAASWTLAALGEEIVYRGYLQTRVIDVLGSSTAGVITAVLLSSVLFGLAHTEQGVIGVVLTFLDALFFSALRWRYRTLWAPVLGHGFNNTLGLVAFFVAGPLTGLW